MRSLAFGLGNRLRTGCERPLKVGHELDRAGTSKVATRMPTFPSTNLLLKEHTGSRTQKANEATLGCELCSPAKSLTFSGLMKNPLVAKKLKS